MGIKALRFAGGLIAALVFIPFGPVFGPIQCTGNCSYPDKKPDLDAAVFPVRTKGFLRARMSMSIWSLMSPPTAIAALVAGELNSLLRSEPGFPRLCEDCRSSAFCIFNNM